MDSAIISYLIVCPLVFLAGFVDAIGGGGGLISLPAYILAGIPIHAAVATNKMSSAMGTTISTLRYIKNGFADWSLAVPSIIMSLLGSGIGANIALWASDKALQITLIIILPIVAFYVLKNKEMEPKANQKEWSMKAKVLLVCMISLAVGMYDGFYGPGTGTFLILAYTGLVHMDMRTASGNTKLVNLASNISALTVFLVNGKVMLPMGMIAGVFCIAGHYIGAGMVMKNGTKIVRPIILVVLVLLFLKIVTGI